MKASTRAGYVCYYFAPFDRFEQAHRPAIGRGRSFTYAKLLLLVFFICMLLRRSTEFKAQHPGLTTHPDVYTDKVLQSEPKDELKQRTGKSPDYAEAFMLTFVQRAVPNVQIL